MNYQYYINEYRNFTSRLVSELKPKVEAEFNKIKADFERFEKSANPFKTSKDLEMWERGTQLKKILDELTRIVPDWSAFEKWLKSVEKALNHSK